MRRYWHILRKYKISLALCPILVLITVWCETIQPMYMAEIVDQGVMKRDLSLIAEKGVYMILISLSGLGFSVVNVYIASRTSIGFGTDLRGALFEKIQRLFFFDLDHFSTPNFRGSRGHFYQAVFRAHKHCPDQASRNRIKS